MKAINKNQQKSTFSKVEQISPQTGLTPIQEKAAILLVSGKNVSDVSNELNIDRGTMYNWFEKINFQAYCYNRICAEVKETIKNGLFGLYDEALNAIKDSLKSENASIKLKTAFWLIKRIDLQDIGQTDPRKSIRAECMEELINVSDWGMRFNNEKYKDLCKENGLNP